MPFDEVLPKFKRGDLRSSSGQPVTDRKQAIAIMLSEKKKAEAGDEEYAPHERAMREAMKRRRK